ncbi:MAG: acetyl-CoA carboxylase, carboxyltransferase subunit beta [bacterium]
MSWFKKERFPKVLISDKRLTIPEGLWEKCNNCKAIIYKKEIERNLNICPKCDYHFRISARQRLELLFDEGGYEEFDANLVSENPLNFKDTVKYKDRLQNYREKTGLNDALINGLGKVKGRPLIACVFEFKFMGGSMASVVGEKIVRGIEKAIETKTPFMTIASSGGARMQEGIFSLMQMAKTSAAVKKIGEAGLPFISLLTDPTMGGVSASFAMLGDVIMAEPKALIGFAGPRVIEQTIRKTLPDGFQRSEFLVEHGMIDMIVDRKHLRDTVERVLRFLLPR